MLLLTRRYAALVASVAAFGFASVNAMAQADAGPGAAWIADLSTIEPKSFPSDGGFSNTMQTSVSEAWLARFGTPVTSHAMDAGPNVDLAPDAAWIGRLSTVHSQHPCIAIEQVAAAANAIGR